MASISQQLPSISRTRDPPFAWTLHLVSWSWIVPCSSTLDVILAQGRLRSDLVTQAEKPLLPWELTRLGARAAMRAVRLSNESSLRGGDGSEYHVS